MDKTWTAIDLRLGKLTIRRVGSTLYLQRRYVFIDAVGEVLTQIAGGNVIEEIEIMDIPFDILSALIAIDDWTKKKALEQEDMNDPD